MEVLILKVVRSTFLPHFCKCGFYTLVAYEESVSYGEHNSIHPIDSV